MQSDFDTIGGRSSPWRVLQATDFTNFCFGNIGKFCYGRNERDNGGTPMTQITSQSTIQTSADAMENAADKLVAIGAEIMR